MQLGVLPACPMPAQMPCFQRAPTLAQAAAEAPLEEPWYVTFISASITHCHMCQTA